MTKNLQKNRAIVLRKQGKTYNEILEVIPVAKSTLSLWLRSVRLAARQKQRLTKRRKQAQYRATMMHIRARQEREKKITEAAIKEINIITKRELWLIGIALYWAEGNKQKNKFISQGAIFSNSDPAMIQLFYKWLVEICDISKDDIVFELYIHKTANSEYALNFWRKALRTGKIRTYFKKNTIRTVRKEKKYFGQIRIKVVKSTNFNRRISGWIKGILSHCRVV